MDDAYYQSKKDAAYRTYTAQPVVRSPFFREDIVLGSEGFRHLSHSTRGERTKEEQVERFILLPLGLHVLRTATTLQTYRKRLPAAGRYGPASVVQWWGFVALFVKQRIKVRVVVRKVGDEQPRFWSVMLSPRREVSTPPKPAARA